MTSTPGMYYPGSSVVHRAPAGVKLLLMLASIITVMLLPRLWQLGIAAAITALLYAAALVPLRMIWAQLAPLKWFVPIIFAFQWWLASWQAGMRVSAMIVIAVALAALVTLTTTVSAMLDALVTVLAPLRLVRIDPERIALVFALTIRCIPLLVGMVAAANEARRARGLGFSPRALVTPVLVRALKTADALGEALTARGVDDV